MDLRVNAFRHVTSRLAMMFGDRLQGKRSKKVKADNSFVAKSKKSLSPVVSYGPTVYADEHKSVLTKYKLIDCLNG